LAKQNLIETFFCDIHCFIMPHISDHRIAKTGIESHTAELIEELGGMTNALQI
jgi:hypothetical protein